MEKQADSEQTLQTEITWMTQGMTDTNKAETLKHWATVQALRIDNDGPNLRDQRGSVMRRLHRVATQLDDALTTWAQNNEAVILAYKAAESLLKSYLL